MENKYAKEKKIIVIGAILLVLTLTIGAAYSLWSYFKVGENQQLVAGEIYMKYTESSNTINIQNAMPTSTYDPSQVFEFTIEGKNTYTKPIWYEIVISWGEEAEDRHTRIPDEFIRFRLTEQLPGGEETEVIKAGKYSDFENGKKIWVNTIAENTRTDTKITYKLYMWVSDEMHLGAGDDASLSDMNMTTWNTDAFASVKVTVNGDFTPKELDEEPEPEPEGTPAVEKIKATLGQEGGIIGVTTSNTKVTQEAENIREYRYSGLGVKNYVKFNNELWRIIGIFKDESGIEHMKIVRDETLSGIPNSYTANDKTFNLSNNGTTSRWDTDSGYDNNWADAGLMNWLNSKGTEDGYLKKLSEEAQGMIDEETKWYLGTVTYDSTYGVKDTPKEAYKYERAVTECTENKGPSANSSGSAVTGNSTCRVWANNAAYWIGEIGLMYPSDYGFSASDSYWDTILGNNSFSGNASNSSWLQKEANHSDDEWFLLPTSSGSYGVAYWYSNGAINTIVAVAGNGDGTGGTGNNSADNNYGVRPSLNLKSTVSIIDGNGEKNTPYELSIQTDNSN